MVLDALESSLSHCYSLVLQLERPRVGLSKWKVVKVLKTKDKEKVCPVCKRKDFNYKQYGESYCNNPEHLPRRVKKI